MKKILFFALPIAAISLLALKPYSEALPIGSSLPEATKKMKDISGAEVSFNDAKKANGLLVMFSCNTCPIVHKYESRTVEICKKALDKGFGVILLNSNEAYRTKGDSYDDMKAYAKKLGYDFYYAVDKNSEMADIFGANRTPECFLFDKNNKLAYHGAIDNGPDDVTRNHLSIAIDELVSNKDVATKVTNSVGCTIKRL